MAQFISTILYFPFFLLLDQKNKRSLAHFNHTLGLNLACPRHSPFSHSSLPHNTHLSRSMFFPVVVGPSASSRLRCLRHRISFPLFIIPSLVTHKRRATFVPPPLAGSHSRLTSASVVVPSSAVVAASSMTHRHHGNHRINVILLSLNPNGRRVALYLDLLLCRMIFPVKARHRASCSVTCCR